RYTCVQTTWAVHVPGTLTAPYALFRQEDTHAGRCCVCGYVIRRPLFLLPSSSVDAMRGLAERPFVAVLSMRLPCGAVWCRLRPRQGLHLPVLPHHPLIFPEILLHDGGVQQRQRHRVAVLRLIRRRRIVEIGMEGVLEPVP